MISGNLSKILLYMRVSWFRGVVSFAGLSIFKPDRNYYGFIYIPNIIRVKLGRLFFMSDHLEIKEKNYEEIYLNSDF